MLRARVRLGAALAGFALIVTQLDFALHALIPFELRGLHSAGGQFVFPVPSLAERLVFCLPAALLALASLLGGVALYRTIHHRSHWSSYAAALAPMAAFLALYTPPVSHAWLLLVKDLHPPWSTIFWNGSLSLGLPVAAYAAAAVYVLAICLAVSQRQRRGLGPLAARHW